jgi:hypothetical protein
MCGVTGTLAAELWRGQHVYDHINHAGVSASARDLSALSIAWCTV